MLVTLVLIGSCVTWYLYYGLECALNGGTVGRNPWTMPFSLAFEELAWFLPGGRRRKGEYIRKQMGSCESGAMCGNRRSWQYKDVRDHDLYEYVGEDMLPGRLHFLMTHVALPFGPPAIAYFVL